MGNNTEDGVKANLAIEFANKIKLIVPEVDESALKIGFCAGYAARSSEANLSTQDFDYQSFFWGITRLCDGMPPHPSAKEDYKNSNTLELQDHIGTHCKLCTIWQFPTMAIIEMAEAYARMDEKVVDKKDYQFTNEHFKD